MESVMVAQAFDKALSAAKKGDMLPAMNLAALLSSMGLAMDDGTLVISAISVGSCGGPMIALSKLETVNPPGLKDLLATSTKELVAALEDLKPQLSGDKRDADAILKVLGSLGKVATVLNQKIMEFQQFPPFGGPGARP